MSTRLVNWDMFLRLQPVFWKYVGALIKEGFDREESYDAVFDAIMYRCQSNKRVKCKHMFLDARRLLLREKGYWRGKKELRRSKLKASLYYPIRVLNDPEFL